MTGYVEALTDPSYAGHILMITYPLIGNYGVCREDYESDEIKVEGFVVREVCETPSNWRSEKAPSGKGSKDDEFQIRRAAVEHNVPYITTIAGLMLL